MPERISASNVARQMACPGSANLELAIPNWVPPVEDRTADNAANRGTAKHEIVEKIVDLSATEMRQMAKLTMYVADVASRRRFSKLIEHTFNATWLLTVPQTSADLVLFTKDEVHVIDYKWGKIPVLVDDNKQLLFYAVCAAALAPKAKGVTVHLLQPPLDYYESKFVDTNELTEFMEEVQETERRIMASDLTLHPSDNCTFCPANPHGRGLKGRPLCPAMMNMLYPPIIDEDEILSL